LIQNLIRHGQELPKSFRTKEE